jgi:hypothetical protein
VLNQKLQDGIMKSILTDMLRFLKGHWIHLLLAVPAVVAFTVLHELAHCTAVWMQGESVTSFVWLPSGGEWGHIQYIIPEDRAFSFVFVSLAPYIYWLLFCLVSVGFSFRSKPWSYWVASIIFIWLFIVPTADFANTAIPYILWNSENDFYQAFGPAHLPVIIMLLTIASALVAEGFYIQRRLYRERAIYLPAYSIFVILGIIALVGITM